MLRRGMPGLVEASGPTTPHIDPNADQTALPEAIVSRPSRRASRCSSKSRDWPPDPVQPHRYSGKRRKLELTPKGTQMGRTYRFAHPTDRLVGNPFTDARFQTFKPTLLRETTGFFDRDDIARFDGTFNTPAFEPSLLGGVGCAICRFLPAHPTTPDRRWHTTITGVRGGFRRSMLFTFDLTTRAIRKRRTSSSEIDRWSRRCRCRRSASSHASRTLVPPIPLPADMTALASWNDGGLHGDGECRQPVRAAVRSDLPEWPSDRPTRA
jgi:hypothetical protein